MPFIMTVIGKKWTNTQKRPGEEGKEKGVREKSKGEEGGRGRATPCRSISSVNKMFLYLIHFRFVILYGSIFNSMYTLTSFCVIPDEDSVKSGNILKFIFTKSHCIENCAAVCYCRAL